MELSELTYLKAFLFASGLLISAGASSLLTNMIRSLAFQYNLVDAPNHRSVHKKPIPRVGGVAIVGGFIVGLLYFYWLGKLVPDFEGLIRFPPAQMLIGALIMAGTGLYDDLRGMRPHVKLYFQCIVALLIILGGFRFNLGFLPLDDLGLIKEVIAIGLTFLWIVGMINAVNLLDGLDGLAAGVSLIAISSLTICIAVTGQGPDIIFVAAFIGTIIGFLVFNSHPAAIFMGDTGSLFLGFLLATFALPVTAQAHNGLSFLVPIAALGLPIMDTTIAIVRRALARKGIFVADKDHIHHRLSSRLGLSHRSTVVCLYGVSMIFGLTAVMIAVANSNPLMALGLALTGSFILFLLLKLEYLIPVRISRENGSQD